jgi:hypothetical protein
MELLNGLKKIDLNKIKCLMMNDKKEIHYFLRGKTEFRVCDNKDQFKFIIPKNSAIILKERTDLHVKILIQGSKGLTNLDKEIFDSFELEETEFTYEFIRDNIDHSLNKGYDELSNCISKLKKEFEKNNEDLSRILRKINTDTFQTKGSGAVKGGQFCKLDLENLPWIGNNLKSKPYSWWENRSERSTYVPTIEEITEWANDPNKIIPIGIKKEEYAIISDQIKIGEKLLNELCGFQGMDNRFIEIVSEFYNIDRNYKHKDYRTKRWLHVDEFKKNTLTSKEKGIELCHLNPNLEYATVPSNITLGTSSTNRKQSGSSTEYQDACGYFEDIYKSNCNELLKEEAQSCFSKIEMNENCTDNLKRIKEIQKQLILEGSL